MEVVGIITTAAVTCLCAPGIRELLASTWQHLKHPRKKLENLVKEIKELTEQAEEMRQTLEQIKIRHGREANSMVNTWLSNVTAIDNEVKLLVARVREDKKGLCGLLPNYRSRLMIGKEISNKFARVLELRKGAQFQDIVHISRHPHAKGQLLSVPDNLSVFGTTRTYIDQIWSYLMDDKVRRIGVHGMGGIGKTTLMKEVNNKLMKSNTCFDCVHWVSASKDFNLDKLQKAIAAAIGLKLSDEEDEDQVRRAGKLLDALMWKRRVVLILDNMWQAFSLEDIGIPKPNRVNGFKLIITTRDLTVCRGMETDNDVEIKVLTEAEAWRIFKGLVGISVSRLPTTTQTIMKDVSNECGGLPLAICTVAKALRKVNNDIPWQNALAALRSPDGNILNMDEKVFGALRFSYENLRDNTTRSCFLYCALFPEAHLIQTEELIEYWIWEGLFGDSEMIKDYVRKGETVLGEIADASLLESACDDQDGRVITYVKMHDMVRDMARRISPQWVIEAGVGLRKPPYEGKWTKDVERISLMRNDLRGLLPSKPMCPRLSSLLLQYNSLTDNISPSFFNHLVYLKVIDLSFTGISFLPDSLSLLVNLRALLLRHCWNLSFLPSLAKLLELRVLDLSFTLITELPRGIEMLTNLRRLNLSHTRLKMLSAGLFSKATRLEHLLMEGSGLVMGSSIVSESSEGSVVEELRGAINLRVLNATFMDMQVFNMYLTFADDLQLESFQLCIGQQHEGCEISPSEEKSIIISGCEIEQNSIILPAYTTELCIAVCFSEQQRPLSIDNASYLKKCRINYCHDVPCIIMDEDNYLSSLETMELKYLDRLLELFPENPPRPGTLESLKILHIANCNNMKNLLSSRWLQHLWNLKEIYVEDCQSMEEIISGVEDCEETISGVELSNAVTLPKLNKLHLSGLKNLKSIFYGVLVCNALRSIEVSGCLKLKRLPRFVPAPWALKEIKGEREWWNNLNWDHAPDTVESLFQPMFIENEQAEESR